MRKILTLALALSITSPCWAIQNIKLGGLNIDPFVSTEMKYDSNIYLTKSNVKSAWINDSSLGLRLNQKLTTRLDLEAGYALDLITYSVNQSNNNAVHHTADLSLASTLADNMTARLGDQFLATTDQASSELTARAKRVENTAAFNFVAPIKGSLGFKINTSDDFNEYLEAAYSNLNRNRWNAGADITYQLMPKTQLQAGYTFAQVKYKDNTRNNSNIHKVDGGLTGQVAPKVTGEIIAGVQFRDYSNNSNTASNKATTFSYGITLAWTPGVN
ncbi:MAG: outer membrane beta-barrel protein, partial [Elusimicrobiaceae bacterium]|nr:outer membrane beta-barrel protein [Elusimicrobiaceae bacterium]